MRKLIVKTLLLQGTLLHILSRNESAFSLLLPSFTLPRQKQTIFVNTIFTSSRTFHWNHQQHCQKKGNYHHQQQHHHRYNNIVSNKHWHSTNNSNNNNNNKYLHTMSLHTKRVVPSSLVSPMEKYSKYIRSIPVPAFLAVTTVVLPVWAVTVLPITVLYQVGKRLLQLPVSGNNHTNNDSKNINTLPPLDSGYVVDISTVLPREKRKYDIVVLGATGFTGRLAVLHLAKTYGIPSSNNKKDDPPSTSSERECVNWAIAGRNETKLRHVLEGLANELQMPSLITNVDIIIVDTSIPCTMPKLVENTRCVATTAGPYTLYGNTVVEFCVKYGTHYVDITGEVEWIQIMIDQWNDLAKQTGSIIVPFCGHE